MLTANTRTNGAHCTKLGSILILGARCTKLGSALILGAHCTKLGSVLILGAHCTKLGSTLIFGAHCTTLDRIRLIYLYHSSLVSTCILPVLYYCCSLLVWDRDFYAFTQRGCSGL